MALSVLSFVTMPPKIPQWHSIGSSISAEAPIATLELVQYRLATAPLINDFLVNYSLPDSTNSLIVDAIEQLTAPVMALLRTVSANPTPRDIPIVVVDKFFSKLLVCLSAFFLCLMLRSLFIF